MANVQDQIDEQRLAQFVRLKVHFQHFLLNSELVDSKLVIRGHGTV